MAKKIYGYIGTSLENIGNLDAELPEEGEDATLQNFHRAYAAVERKVSSVERKNREWIASIAVIKDEKAQKEYNVLVLGMEYEENQPRPEIPASLDGLFQGETLVDLFLKYQDDEE